VRKKNGGKVIILKKTKRKGGKKRTLGETLLLWGVYGNRNSYDCKRKKSTVSIEEGMIYTKKQQKNKRY